MNPEPGAERGRSRWNGYKLMNPHITDAVRYGDRAFPSNLDNVVGENPRERSVVFHDPGGNEAATGRSGLVPGRMNLGTEAAVEVPPDLGASSARVFVHTHPFTGRHMHDIPSLADHLVARRNPNVEHIVQIPAPRGRATNPYILYTGAIPPRHYTLVENPDNLPVPPHSPDVDRLPPVHRRPETGSGPGKGFPPA
jgi:hypothetical protein